MVDGIPAPRIGSPEDPAGYTARDGQPAGARPGAAGRPDPGGTRRKSVVFEEDDELDVPDFLK
jgi:hypothetical protein